MKDKLLSLLPQILINDQEKGNKPFIKNYLRVFEAILLGDENHDTSIKGINEIISLLANLFHPEDPVFSPDSEKTYDQYIAVEKQEFYNWLAGWMALLLEEIEDAKDPGKVISKVIPLYRMRGTKRGIEELLNIYLSGTVVTGTGNQGNIGVKITEHVPTYCVGVNSYVGEMYQALVGGLPAYHFIVDLILAKPDEKLLKRKVTAVKKVLNMEKPVHTSYKLNVIVPRFCVGKQSTVGVDTLI